MQYLRGSLTNEQQQQQPKLFMRSHNNHILRTQKKQSGNNNTPSPPKKKHTHIHRERANKQTNKQTKTTTTATRYLSQHPNVPQACYILASLFLPTRRLRKKEKEKKEKTPTSLLTPVCQIRLVTQPLSFFFFNPFFLD